MNSKDILGDGIKVFRAYFKMSHDSQSSGE